MKVDINNIILSAYGSGQSEAMQKRKRMTASEISCDMLKKHAITPEVVLRQQQTLDAFGSEPVTEESIELLKKIKFI